MDWMLMTLIWAVAIGNGFGDTVEPGKIKFQGDIMLGGLFPMHEAGNPPNPCGTIKEEKGIQRAEAMLYAIDEINSDPDLLPNVTLGALMLDTCSRDTYALEQAMEFLKSSLNEDMSDFHCRDGSVPELSRRFPVAGVIGAASSTESIMVANILRLFKIPQISYSSTSAELSDKARFGYFSRVVPPDNIQAQAMVDVVKVLGWRWVSTVAVEGEYGEKGIASFTELAEKRDVCIAVSEKIARSAKELDFDRIVQHLRSEPRARAVVIFVDEDNTRKLLAATIRANITGHFLWVGSDSWGAKIHPVRAQEAASEGAITILPQRTNVEGFDVHFNRLTPANNKRNVWFKEFWEMHFKCSYQAGTGDEFSLKNGPRLCQDNFTLLSYEQEGLVPFVVDAVYSMAHALHSLIADVCGTDPFYLCDQVNNNPDGFLLLQHIRNVSFIGRQNREVKFNSAGDAFGSYDIFQYQKVNGRYDYVKIGNWSEGLYLNWHQLKWKEGNASVPISICSDDCEMGHHRSYQGSKCCWNCVPCREDEFMFNDTCIACPMAYRPNDVKSACVRLSTEFMTWNSPWALVPIAFASIGMIVTLAIIAIFVRYNSTPVIMASGRELCYVLLIGIFTCYGTTFVLLAKPTTSTCTLLRICLGLCLSICYSAIFTKTNRISRIFNRGVRSVKRPRYTSPTSQIAISLAIVAFQLFGSIAWLIMEEPRTKESYPTRFTVVLQCGISNVSLIVSLVYNMILIALCTWYAFKTRKIPENFNEAKYIGFSMYSTCIVWLAFIPIYFGTHNDYRIQIASICMCLSISATVALGCLFTPKLYIVLLQPYKNVRQGGQQSSGGGGGAGGQSRSGYSQSMKFNRPSRSSPRPTQTNGDVPATSPSAEESSMSIASISK